MKVYIKVYDGGSIIEIARFGLKKPIPFYIVKPGRYSAIEVQLGENLKTKKEYTYKFLILGKRTIKYKFHISPDGSKPFFRTICGNRVVVELRDSKGVRKHCYDFTKERIVNINESLY